MVFNGVVGQRRVKKIFESSLTRDRLAHAYLFHGQTGVGKDAMAVSVAMGLNCTGKIIGGCGECATCLGMSRLEHPSFQLILPVPARPKTMKEGKYQEILRERAIQWVKNPYQTLSYTPELTTLPLIGIEQIRAVKHQVVLKLSGGGYRVILISRADRMTSAAANSLLKLLEEPPPRTILFLTTSAPGMLPQTIISRCQVIRFDFLSEEEIENALVQRWGVSRANARLIARMAGGSLQRSLTLIEEGFEQQREEAFVFLERSLEGETHWGIDGMGSVSNEKNRVEVQDNLRLLQVWIRDLLHLRLGLSGGVMNIDRIEKMERFLEKWPDFDAEAGIKCVEQAIDFIEKNVYLPLAVFSLSQDLKKCRRMVDNFYGKDTGN